MLRSDLLSETVQFTNSDHLLILNSAADPFVPLAAQRLIAGRLTLAEDNIAALQAAQAALTQKSSLHIQLRHVAFHKYISESLPATMDVAIMNLVYQPGNAWVAHGLYLAAYALKPGGSLYVLGARDRGVLSVAKRMQALFGNVETVSISKGQRVLRSFNRTAQMNKSDLADSSLSTTFAAGKLDEGTALLLEALEIHVTDEALDIGCGAGFLGTYIAHQARRGHVTMLDSSLAAVDATRDRVEQSGLTNISVLPSNGAQAVLSQRFDLVVTNPPFHQGGLQTTAIAERFIHDAAQVLRPRGRFYLVANRFLKYEPTLRAHFKIVEEVAGNTRYKVLRSTHPFLRI